LGAHGAAHAHLSVGAAAVIADELSSAAASSAAAAAVAPVVIVGAGPVGLTLANLLAGYGVSATVLERSSAGAWASHPQAHFINARSMEVFRHTGGGGGGGSYRAREEAGLGARPRQPSVAEAICAAARPREEWGRFLYTAGPLLTGEVLGTTTHFPRHTLAQIDAHSPQRPMHLPQHRLLPLLLEALPPPEGEADAAGVGVGRAGVTLRWGTECVGVGMHCEGDGDGEREVGVVLRVRAAAAAAGGAAGGAASDTEEELVHARYVVAVSEMVAPLK
jgi:2-polyprenyl-6-methoxyphenol hydroxylase-like FAD-dependent oxidoreductase